MLQKIREKSSGWVAGVILGLVIITMAFFGIGDYFTPKIDTYAARIEGPAKFLGWGGQAREIQVDAFRQRFEAYRAQRRQAEGESFDSAGFDNLENKRRVLDEMIDEQIAAMAAERDGLVLVDEQIAEILKQDPRFQVNGVYSPEQYRLELAATGRTHAQYMAAMRAQWSSAVLPSQIVETAFVSRAEVEQVIELGQQSRDLLIVDLSTPSLPEEAPAEAELLAWYEAHADFYRTPEQVAIEYVEIDSSKLPPPAAPDEETLRQRYAEQKARFGSEPVRGVAHLLIEVPAGADAAADAAAREKAATLAEQARAPGADFAALVAASSDDAGSRASGGELGVVGDGLFPSEALEALTEVGQISDPVRTSAGWHVLKLTQYTPGQSKPFEEVRAELEAEYLTTEQERVFSELANRLLEQIYKTPTALAPAAEAVNLPVQRTGLFTRAQGDGIAAIDDVRRVAFRDEQRLDRQVSDTIEVGPGTVVALHVIEHVPEAPIPFADVRDRVLADYNADRLAKGAKAQAESLLARLQAGETLEAVAEELNKTPIAQTGVTRRGMLPPAIAQAVFSLPVPAADGRSYGIAATSPDQYILFAVTKVTPGEVSEEIAPMLDMLVEQFAQARGDVEYRQYLRALRSYYTVKIAEDRL
ncbi:SurA N-terminal domain-containing protein [Arenimonas composti]|uniref:Periplasmic chaperone PpiD n=1 Tax=Arenimonas composti TR7-09 = DSM 18010 TaxID=1121013 RepID=A0A091C1A3_9GAMM|nr:SurA N-terminal domain-containing protein [Arenimonas composti]KFN50395.1 hypothetical protein P873_06955 [Arenimonas composti TR7-09 = DSM 18010]